MRRSTHHEFHVRLREQLGDALRSIVYYDSEEQYIVYLREEVTENITAVQASELIEYLREREDIAQVRSRLGLDADLKCTVHCWGDRIGLRFPHGPKSGTLVTMNPSAARNLYSFVSDCEAALN